jgi:nicotine oxidoreductase
MHHVKHVQKNGYHYGRFHKEMGILNHKQIPLCKECQRKVYDAFCLANLKET